MKDRFPNYSACSVLVVDDEPGIRNALQANFIHHGWNVKVAGGVQEALSLLGEMRFDLVVSDIRMQDGDGFEVMAWIKNKAQNTAIILLTAFGSVPEAVSSIRDGAIDYLTKPISFDQLKATAEAVMSEAKHRPNHCAADNVSSEHYKNAGGIVGRSPLLLTALRRARAAAGTGADILVEAESGTGKELLAKFIHQASDRSRKPFVAVNCAAVPDHLLESELFGHAKGAFTGASATKVGKFELADGGTLLLDEIGEMPLNLQPKLLRVLQEREFERLGETRPIHVNIRVIATTNASLASMVDQARFRSDLYYRLNVIPLSIPTLRDRVEDIPLLAKYFAERFAAESGCSPALLDASFVHQLLLHRWPGNVRELSNFMRRVLSLHKGEIIDATCFHQEFQPIIKVNQDNCAIPVAGTSIAALEKMHLENTLALTHGNRTHTAVMLGISLRTVRNKIKEYGLPPRSYA